MGLNTYPANVSGHPAITVPCGIGEHNLPIGLQIIGPRLGEARILRAAHQFETLFGRAGGA
jgi:aspartyl-tRNA(Asn)/glutamyl-tRNA(Gln) amidotransferase subunit A